MNSGVLRLSLVGAAALSVLLGANTPPRRHRVPPLETSSLEGTYTLTAVCAIGCGGGFVRAHERVTLVMSDTTIDVSLANPVVAARIRATYARMNGMRVGPANACYVVATAEGLPRMVHLAHWTPSDSSAVVTLEQFFEARYRVLLTLSPSGARVTLPTRADPAPDSLVQFTGVRSGPADPARCLRAAEQIFADSGGAAR
jgi:hypothetical protein